MFIYDMRPQRLPQRRWTAIHDYAVFDARGRLIICPQLLNLQHKGYSNVFDYRAARDELEGIKRVNGKG